MNGLGYYMRLVLAGARGIGGRPVPLHEIDLGADEADLLAALVSSHAAFGELTVEQARTWGALALYCLARCHARDAVCGLATFDYASRELAAIRSGVDVWRLKQVAAAREAGLLVDGLRISEEPSVPPPPIPFEVAWLAPTRPFHRFRIRLNPDIEWEGPEPLGILIDVPDRPDVEAVVTEAAEGFITKGRLAVLVTDEWEEVRFELRGSGPRGVRRVEIVGVRGWEGRRSTELLSTGPAAESDE